MRHIAAGLIAVVLASAGPAFAQERGTDSARVVRERLASLRLSIDFTNAKLEEAIAYFQEFSGLNFHLDASARAKDGEDVVRVTMKLKDVSMKTALKLILNPRDLGCVYRDGVIVVAAKSRLGSETVTRVYDIRDVLSTLQDFPGPKFELDKKNPGLEFAPFLSDDPKATFTEESIMDLVKTSTGERTWEDAQASISQVNGLLIVAQSKTVHEEVRRLLDLLRQYK